MRLYVQPIVWTADHLRLLELRFLPVKREGREQTQPPSGDINGTPDSTVDDIAIGSQEKKRFDVPDMNLAVERLCSRNLDSKKFSTREVLLYCNMHLESECVPFYFDGKPVANLRTDGIFWSHTTSPCVACLAFPAIERLRRRLLRKRLRALEPQDPSEDPYIAAVLIALAQAQRRHQQRTLRKKDAKGATRNQAYVPSPPGSRATKPDARSSKKSKPDARSSKKANPDARRSKKANSDVRSKKKSNPDARSSKK
ncbi:hypothetical protein N7535_006932 [Penicillium sp. DV-2018c]|nr:hypothetical protein N7535_006932 [Penicillium sp. DV-2018c]